MKKKIRVLQFSAGFQIGDAISQEMIELKRLLSISGYTSTLYAENINKPDRSYVNKYNKADIEKDDIILYHHSIHSEVLSHILKYKNNKILVYHNVTPHHFFEPYDLKFTYLLKEGRNDLEPIKTKFDAFFAVSKFNQKELIDSGILNSQILNLNLNFNKWNLSESIKKGNAELQFLFVGRLAPNKRQDDLIRFVKLWKEKTKSSCQLKLIGFCNPNQQTYFDELEFMVRTYGLEKNVEIVSAVNESILSKYYRESDYFISMSEHEGFCVPLMEAMYFGLPIFAFDAGAVSETLGGAGVLFSEKKFTSLIDTILSLEADPKAKEHIIRKQRERINFYIKSLTIEPLLSYLRK